MQIDGTEYAQTAFALSQMDVETAALVRVAEDTLRLTWQMQELWIAGGLNTLQSSSETVEGKAEKAERPEAVQKSERQVVAVSGTRVRLMTAARR